MEQEMYKATAKYTEDERREYKAKIISYKEKHGLSAYKMADLLDVSQSTAYRLCSNPEYLPNNAIIQAYQMLAEFDALERCNTLHAHLTHYFKVIRKDREHLNEVTLMILSNTLNEILNPTHILTLANKKDRIIKYSAYYEFITDLVGIFADLASQKQAQINRLSNIDFTDEQINKLQQLIAKENAENEELKKRMR